MRRIDSERLGPLLRAELLAAGVREESAAHVAGSLIETSLRGVDLHGIQLFPHYVRAARGGRINVDPAFRVARRYGATAVVDADHGFGHHAGSYATGLAVEIAEELGVGAVGVRNSTHFGAAAYFALQAARKGFLGLAFTNADALVQAFGGNAAAFGTNPICLTAPMRGEEPFCLDMATSQVSWNKIRNYRREKVELPPGWASDADGNPTTDAAAARMLSASGGYKGFGLGMMVELLCGFLADGPIATELLPMYSAPISARRRISHFFMALRVETFLPLDRFSARLSALAEQVRGMSSGEQRVMIPGDPEKRTFAERKQSGIPVGDEELAQLLELSRAFERTLLG